MRARWLASLFVGLPLIAVTGQVQQGVQPPPGSAAMIIIKLRDVQFDAARAAKASAAGRTVTVTPVRANQSPANQAALEAGAVVAQVVVDGSSPPPLTPGTYHVFVSKTKQGLTAQFERNGQVVASAPATFENYPPPGGATARPVVTVGDARGGSNQAVSGGPSADDAQIRSAAMGKIDIEIPTGSGKIRIYIEW